MNDNTYEDELEINLADLFWSVLSHWRSLIAFILVGAVLGIGFSYYQYNKDLKAYEASKDPASQLEADYEPDAESLAKMELAARYRTVYEQEKEYSEKSYYINMDPANVYMGKISFSYSAGDQTDALQLYYKNIVNDEELLNTLCAQTNGTVDNPIYMQELLKVQISVAGTITSGDKDSKTNTNTASSALSYMSGHDASVEVTIYYSDKDTASAMTDTLETYLDTLNTEIAEEYADFETGSYTVSCTQTYLSDLLEDKSDLTDALDDAYDTYTDAESSFEDSDLVYYRAQYLSDEVLEREAVKPNFSKKYAIIIIAIFVLLWILIYALGYITSGKMHVGDAEILFGFAPISVMKGKSGKKFWLDKFIENTRCQKTGPSDNPEFVCRNIQLLNHDNILICEEGNTPEQNRIIALIDETENMTYSDYLRNDSSRLAGIKNYDGIIYVVHDEKTDRNKIKNELYLCRIQNIRILGYIEVKS